MYCKLFASLYQGTLRGKSHEILVFTNLLAHADAEGYVDKHFRAIADEVGLTVEEVKTAITLLESPDSESRSPENEGRRLLRINDHRAWGWQVVNYAKYRNIKSDEDRRKANREAQQRYRDKHKGKKNTPKVIESNDDVIERNQESAPSAQGEGEEEGKEEVSVRKKSFQKPARNELEAFCRESQLFPRDAEYLWNRWEGNGWVNGGKKIKDWKATIRSWKACGYLPSQKSPSASDCWPSETVQQPEEEEDLLAKWNRAQAEEKAREDALCQEPESVNGGLF
jgi:hypothetical protein